MWEFWATYMKPLGLLKNTLQISAIIIAVIPESIFVGLPSDPKGDLHFFVYMKVTRKHLLAQSPRNGTERPRNRIIFLIMELIVILCVPSRLVTLLGVVRTGKMDGRSGSPLLASPLVAVWSRRPQARWGLEDSSCLSLECTPSWERNHRGIYRWWPCLAGANDSPALWATNPPGGSQLSQRMKWKYLKYNSHSSFSKAGAEKV